MVNETCFFTLYKLILLMSTSYLFHFLGCLLKPLPTMSSPDFAAQTNNYIILCSVRESHNCSTRNSGYIFNKGRGRVLHLLQGLKLAENQEEDAKIPKVSH